MLFISYGNTIVNKVIGEITLSKPLYLEAKLKASTPVMWLIMLHCTGFLTAMASKVKVEPGSQSINCDGYIWSFYSWPLLSFKTFGLF